MFFKLIVEANLMFIFLDNNDLIKPSIIKDLRVDELDMVNNLVTLKFTAPGDNHDIGTGKFNIL